MRPNLLATSALFLAALSQFAPAQAPTPVASRLAAQNALFDDAWQTNLKMNPTLATAVGDYRYNDQLGDYSLAASANRAANKIYHAVIAGRAEITITPQAWLAARVAGLAPETTQYLASLVNEFVLPAPSSHNLSIPDRSNYPSSAIWVQRT